VTLLSALDGVLDEALAVMAEAAPTMEDGGQVAGQAGAQDEGTPKSGGSGALVPAFRQAYGQVAAACAVYSQVLHAGQVSAWLAGPAWLANMGVHMPTRRCAGTGNLGPEYSSDVCSCTRYHCQTRGGDCCPCPPAWHGMTGTQACAALCCKLSAADAPSVP
jgi:hypothetical protein